MAWVHFTHDFDFRVKQGVTTAYKVGMVLNVPARCAREAIALKRAEAIKAPYRHELNEVQNDGR